MQTPPRLISVLRRLRLPVTGLVAACAATLPAQITSPALATPDAAKQQEVVIELSPFVVNAERDTGYQATNTLAGSRLTTPLKDLGASISVYTKDFLADIGATNVGDLLVFATGMESSGSQGNYSGTGASISEPQIVGDGPRNNPQGGARTRGLASPEFTRNFFISSIAIDSYNTSAVTVNRGANAILFGIGSPAGVVDTALIQANLSKTTTRVEYRYGDNSSNRASIDTNLVVIPGKLALRMAALDDRENYDQRPAYEDKKRVFATMTLRPFRSTTLRANIEDGRTRANRPITVLPFNSINKYWLAAGRPSYDWTFYDDPARNPLASTQTSGVAFLPVGVASGQLFSTIIIPYAPGSATPGNSFRSNIGGTNITGTNSLTANTIRNQLFEPSINRDLAADGNQFYETVNIGEPALPASAFPGGVRPVGLKMQGFTDYSAFAFNKQMIDETSFQGDNFQTYSVALEQSLWRDRAGQDRVGIELAFNNENFDRYASNMFFSAANGNHVRVDPNVTLPDGTPNPNVGRPYTNGAVGSQRNFYESERENKRATAFLRYDTKDAFPILGRWLGRHTLTGLYEEYAVNQLNYNNRPALFGPVADTISSNPNGFSRRPAALAYLGNSLLNGSDLKLQAIKIQPVAPGLSTPTTYFTAPAGSAVQGTITTAPTTIQDVLGDGTVTREVIKSQAVVLHGYWVDDLIVTTVGWRRDEDYLYRRAITYLENPAKNRYALSDFALPGTPPATVAGEVISYSGVLRWPQKLIRLPRGMDFSVFYNQSSNFTPTGGRITALVQDIPPPTGETQEFGFNVSFFDDKLSIRVNRFETSVKNQTFSPGVYSDAYNNGVRQLANFWASERNINPGIDRTADIERLFSPVPEFRQGLNFQYTGGTGGVPYGSTQTNPPGITDTTDFVAKGTEMEVVYNPTRNWRIALNVSKQETVQSNVAPATRDFIEKMKPIWTEFSGRPRENYPAGFVVGSPLPANVTTVGTWIQTNILVPYATLLASEGQVSAEQRKWRANLVTNYTFSRRFLKGFGVGTGIRWQDKYALGYPANLNPDGSVFVDIKNPYMGKAETNVDVWVSYSRKVYRDKINWKVQLNARNVVGSDDPIAISVQPDGSTAVTRIPPEKRFYLTNTFEF
ncbi:MAG: TonB-dependent receptor plug domain-containing protein [Lacunisphaera sp.]|nr:TonB-dependent receptor plug domain-containing protein [Lacunisphaera sp.]